MSKASASLTLQRTLFNLLSRTRLLHPLVRRIWPAVQLDVGGHELLLHPADNATERFMWLRGTRREAASIGRLTLLVAGKRSLVFDIGANCGAFTLPLAETAGAGSRIVAFEPNPVMAARLKQNLVRNGLDHRVTVQEVSIAARDGQARLWIGMRNLGLSTLHVSASSLQNSIEVPVRRLQHFLPPSGVSYDVFVIKCDIEGCEDQALVPFLKVISDDHLPNAILVETVSSHLWRINLAAVLECRGYKAYFEGEDGNTMFLRRG